MKYSRNLIPLSLPLIFTLSNVSDHMENTIFQTCTIQKQGIDMIVTCQKQSVNNKKDFINKMELTISEPSYTTCCHQQSKSLSHYVKLFNTKSEDYLLCPFLLYARTLHNKSSQLLQNNVKTVVVLSNNYCFV